MNSLTWKAPLGGSQLYRSELFECGNRAVPVHRDILSMPTDIDFQSANSRHDTDPISSHASGARISSGRITHFSEKTGDYEIKWDRIP